jgi:hypothetical protein
MSDSTHDRQFVESKLLSKNGNLNPRALEKYNLTKEMAYQIFNEISEPLPCKECGQATSFISFKKGYTSFCSVRCVSKNKEIIEKRASTVVDNFGPEGLKSVLIQEKKKKTSMTNYGTSHPLKNKDFMLHLQDVYLQKYGTKTPYRTEMANEKRINTNLQKYGSENPLSSVSIRTQIENTNIEKYGVKTVLMLPENKKTALEHRRQNEIYQYLDDVNWLEANKNVPSTLLSEQYGIAFSTILNYFKKHNIERPNIIVSKQEIMLTDFLRNANIRYVTSERTILDGKEIDIYLPDYRVGIEVHGVYWHSEQFVKDNYYHAKKRQMALEKNVHLIQITDEELKNNFDIVKERILSKLGKSSKIYARKCKLVEVDSRDCSDFLKKHHIQGPVAASIRIGLEYDSNLIAVMTFSKARYSKKYDWELIRYASAGTVVGGASRCFKYFVNRYTPSSIVSYADLRWNTGEMYTKIGMDFSHTSKPNYWYIVNGKLTHRTQFQKHKLKDVLIIYDENLTEWQNMKNNSYTRFWDCGSNVYVWSKK